MRAWIVGPTVATIVLVVLGLGAGYLASGGGLFICAFAAFWAGTGVAAAVDPPRQRRHAVIVACYLVLLLSAYFSILEFRPMPPGLSHGGPNEPNGCPPR